MEGPPDNNIIQVLQNISHEYGISNIGERCMQPVAPPGSTMDELATKVLEMCQRGDGAQPTEGRNGSLYDGGGLNLERPQIRCQVDGCNMDLLRLKDYHQRYRICAEHLRSDFVIRDGQKMRFCQQCGKFQSLDSFDLDKRSCRERLRRHNERRRKRVEPGHVSTRSEGKDNGFISCDQDMGTIADLLSYMGACRDMDEAHIAAIMEGKNPSSLRKDQNAISSAKIISMILNKNMDSISPRPLVPNLPTMKFLLRQFSRMFHYQLGAIQITPCPEAMSHHAAVHEGDEANNKRVRVTNSYNGMELRKLNKSEDVFDEEHST